MKHATRHSSRPEAPVRRRLGLATIVVAWSATALAGCAHSARAVEDDREFPTRIVTPLCADTSLAIMLELLRVSRDFRPRKPSKDVRHYLVDLRIQRRGQPDLCLLVDEDPFPSAVDSVRPGGEPGGAISLDPEDPRDTWWFSGNDIVRAWPLGRASKRSFMNIGVS